jgi:MFS family permease
MQKKLLPIYFLNFVNVLGFTLLIPVLPSIVREYSDSQIFYGIVISTYPFFQFLASPVLGAMSDTLGRRPVLILSQAGTLLSWFVFLGAFLVKGYYIGGISLGLFVILISRMIDGITGGNVSVANAYLTDIVPPKNRSKIFANMGVVFGLGFIIGPTLGGLSASTSLKFVGTIIFASIVSLFTLLTIIFWLPESLKKKNRNIKLNKSVFKSLNIVFLFLQIKNIFIYRILLVRLFFALIFSGFTPLLVLFLEDKFNMTPRDLGVVFLVLGLFIFINQGMFSKMASSFFGELRSFLLGVVITFLGIISMSFINSIFLFYITMFFISLGNSLVFPNFKALLSNNVDSKSLGLINGLDESILAISNVISPVIATLIYGYYHFTSFAFYTLILIFCALIVSLLLEKLLVLKYGARKEREYSVS